ncbi:MAG: glycosyltransferase family 2 protein [Pseudohongiellaceae bacterium]
MSRISPDITVLLPVHNGERFLSEQLDSIISQTYENWRIVMRDDGSTDGSAAIMLRYSNEFPDRIEIVESDNRNLGAAASFSLLMQYALGTKPGEKSEPSLIALSDQDDIWNREKLEVQVAALLGADHDGDLPLLVHSDLRVVDANLNTIAGSFIDYHGLTPRRNTFRRSLVVNSVTGSTTVFNETLARKALPVPGDAVMHDWWLSLVALAFGSVVYLDRTLVDYRQHEANVSGAKKHLKGNPLNLRRLFDTSNADNIAAAGVQARAFRERYAADLDKWQNTQCRRAERMSRHHPALQKILNRLFRF